MRDPTASGQYAQKKKAIRGEDNHYIRKPVYSTEHDKQAPSEGEIIEKSDHTSYSGDKFESEDDQSDDFRLPKHHEQNLETSEPSYQNIKKQIESQKQPKVYLSTGSQASMLKKEEKKTLASKAQKLKSQQQVTLSKDQVMESQIRKTMKILLTKL